MLVCGAGAGSAIVEPFCALLLSVHLLFSCCFPINRPSRPQSPPVAPIGLANPFKQFLDLLDLIIHKFRNPFAVHLVCFLDFPYLMNL